MYEIGDIIETKKKHPCGSVKWEITRTGADYKLRCLGCGRIVMLSYDDFKRRAKRKVSE